MQKKSAILRGTAVVSSLLLGSSMVAGNIMEQYRQPLDAVLGTVSQKTVVDETESDEDLWPYKARFTTAKEAYEGLRDFALKESQETVALLKNDNNTLPLKEGAAVTLLGMRSYSSVYGGSMASIADAESVKGNELHNALMNHGFSVNPTQLNAYQAYLNSIGATEWSKSRGGSYIPEYEQLTLTNDVVEPTPDELAAVAPDYASEYTSYGDAAIVVFGRPGGEGMTYYPDDLADGVTTQTGHILSLTDHEMAILNHAKANFDKVIVLLNSGNQLDIKYLQDDPDVDAILWIGMPGSYGFNGVAEVLNGTVNPSAHLGDTYATNSTLAPSMQNFGEISWGNLDTLEGDNINSYLIESEGIYTGYRYYETRYADVVAGVEGAAAASAGTYAAEDGTPATVDGTWDYSHEMVYPFGYGLSYTTFEQMLDSAVVTGDKKTATVTVTVKNTGSVAGKDVVEVYAQAPYTDYDKANKVEKSAIQLMDYEKTDLLEPGASQTITMQIDMANLASYDYTNAQTYIVEGGDYYLAIGNDCHDALNNVLAAQGYTTEDGMTDDGDAAKTYHFTWDGGVDSDTFSVSETGTEITNHLTTGDYAMDINEFAPGTVTYLTRSDWNGTFPKTISDFEATDRMADLLDNDFVPISTTDDTSDIVFGDTSSDITFADMKGASFDDPRWDELLNKATISDFLNFAASSFHAVAEYPSVGLAAYNTDDGPGGADNHMMSEGQYQGKQYEDAADYADFSTRVAPAPINLAYSWNKELAEENGEIILGETTLMFNLPLIIGPGANIHRHAWNGRGFEYYSEDPILSGYTGSAVTQGAQRMGCMVNIKHPAFNDQEINRSGVAVFTNEQAARELELKNLQQIMTASGKPASYVDNADMADLYQIGALGIMSSYNRIGCVASSSNYGVMYQIMREEWGFQGYSVTDMLGTVNMAGAPKESLLAGTTNFCAFSADPSLTYWNEDSIKNDHALCQAIRENTHYALYALANSSAVNGLSANTHVEMQMTWWRAAYLGLIALFAVIDVACVVLYILNAKKRAKKGA